MSTEPFDDILNRAKDLTPDERRRLIDELSKSVGTTGDSGDGRTLFDALNDRGIIGSITDNPDASPSTDVDRYGIIGRARRTFRVGRDEIHTICVETSIWRGLRTHSIDAAGNSTPTRRGPYRIQLGTTEQHQIEVRVDKAVRVNAYVDGKLVEYDLFPRVRVVIFALVAAFVVVAFSSSLILFIKLFDV